MTLRIQGCPQGKSKIVHENRLWYYHDPVEYTWTEEEVHEPEEGTTAVSEAETPVCDLMVEQVTENEIWPVLETTDDSNNESVEVKNIRWWWNETLTMRWNDLL